MDFLKSFIVAIIFSSVCVFVVSGFGLGLGSGAAAQIPVAPVTELCSEVNSEHCTRYGFNSTSFPNYIGQMTVRDADITLGAILGQIKFCTINRHNAEMIACAIHVPICMDGAKIPPCSEDCKEVITTCKVNELPGLSMALTICGIFPTRSSGKCVSMPE